MKTASLLFFLLLVSLSDLSAQPGILDKSFGEDGVSLVGVGVNEDIAQDIVIQSDGKILITGYSGILGQQTSMIRLNTNGSLDTTFGKGGKVVYIGETYSHNQRITLYTNGTILICADDAERPVMMWFKPDGSVDSSFAKNGRLGEFFARERGIYHRAFILPDSSIVAAGSHGYYNSDTDDYVFDIGLTYITKRGMIDSSKGKAGRVLFDMRGFGDYASDALMQSNGKIVIGGSFGSSTDKHFHLIRFYPNGMLDSSFGTNGITSTEISDGINSMKGLSDQSDGKILAAGTWYDGGTACPTIVRYMVNGIVDSSFAMNGILKMDNNNNYEVIQKAMMDSVGRIVVVGWRSDSTICPMLYRLMSNGTLDSTFGANGLARFDFSEEFERGEAVAIASDGKYIIGGHSVINDSASYDFAVLRVLADGELDVKQFRGKDNPLGISLYPNPTGTNVTIRATLENDSYCTLKLYGDRGELVKIFFQDEFQTEGIFEKSIWLSDILQGVYFITLDDGKTTHSVKILKE